MVSDRVDLAKVEFMFPRIPSPLCSESELSKRDTCWRTEVKHHSFSLAVLGIGSKETEADVARGLMPALNLKQAQRNMLQHC